jgi:upstream activation factor subunit UAF30
MAKTSSSKATKTTDVSVSTPAPVSTPSASVETASVEKASTKTKKPKAVKQEAASAPEPVAAPTPTPTPVVEAASADATAEVSVTEQSLEFIAKLQQLGLLISSLKTEYRTLEKKWTRELKASQKQNSRRKRKTGIRKPSGFVKPTRISDELATFLGKDVGSEMARTEVTREINAYIRANKLQDENNGRTINPDMKLASLLKIQKSDVLTYFNLQRYMSPHFAKSVKAETTTA